MAKRATFADSFKMDSFLEAKGNIKSINNPDTKSNINEPAETRTPAIEDIRNSVNTETSNSVFTDNSISLNKDMGNSVNEDISKTAFAEIRRPAITEIPETSPVAGFSTKQSVSLSLDLYDAWNLYKSNYKRMTGKSLSLQAYIEALLREGLKDYLH